MAIASYPGLFALAIIACTTKVNG